MINFDNLCNEYVATINEACRLRTMGEHDLSRAAFARARTLMTMARSLCYGKEALSSSGN